MHLKTKHRIIFLDGFFEAEDFFTQDDDMKTAVKHLVKFTQTLDDVDIRLRDE